MRRGIVWGGLDTRGSESCLTVIDDQLALVLGVAVPSATNAVVRPLHGLGAVTITNIAVEASNTSRYLVRGLRSTGVNTTMYEAAQVSRYLRVRLNKTDVNDTRGLTEIAKLRPPSISTVHLKSVDTQLARVQLVLLH